MSSPTFPHPSLYLPLSLSGPWAEAFIRAMVASSRITNMLSLYGERRVTLLLRAWMITEDYQGHTDNNLEDTLYNTAIMILLWAEWFYCLLYSFTFFKCLMKQQQTVSSAQSEGLCNCYQYVYYFHNNCGCKWTRTHASNFILSCKYIPDTHYCKWIFIGASQHLCLHLCISVSQLCSLC